MAIDRGPGLELDFDFYGGGGGTNIGHGFNSNMSGIEGMMASIIHRAILDLSCRQLVDRRSAFNFFKSQDRTYVFSFLRICEHLKVPPRKFIDYLCEQKLL